MHFRLCNMLIEITNIFLANLKSKCVDTFTLIKQNTNILTIGSLPLCKCIKVLLNQEQLLRKGGVLCF